MALTGPNTTGVENMADPRYPEGGAVMFLWGDDPEARATAATFTHGILRR